MNKKIIAIVISAVLLIGSTAVYAASLKTWVNPANKKDVISEVNYPIYVNGVRVDMKDPDTGKDQTVMGYNGRTYVPVRKIAEILGADSSKMWDNGTVQIITPEHSIPTDFIQANVFPNGHSVREAIITNAEINNAAKNAVAGLKTKEAKAKALYNYILDRMNYDDNTGLVGAIGAYTTHKGVCYDYATLYAVMADAVGLNVRLVGGVAVNQDFFTNYPEGNHAWNEVQGDNGEWFAVDTTWGDDYTFLDENGAWQTRPRSEARGWKFHEKDWENEDLYNMDRISTWLFAEYENY